MSGRRRPSGHPKGLRQEQQLTPKPPPLYPARLLPLLTGAHPPAKAPIGRYRELHAFGACSRAPIRPSKCQPPLAHNGIPRFSQAYVPATMRTLPTPPASDTPTPQQPQRTSQNTTARRQQCASRHSHITTPAATPRHPTPANKPLPTPPTPHTAVMCQPPLAHNRPSRFSQAYVPATTRT